MEGAISMDKKTLNILTKMRINHLTYCLLTYNFIFSFILNIILFFLFFITFVFVKEEMCFLLLVFPILSVCITLLMNYNGQKIDEALESFEDNLEQYITEKKRF